MEEKIILIGGGGHCRSCIDVIEQEGRFKISGIVERAGMKPCGHVLGYPVIGTDDDLGDLRKDFSNALVTVGQIKSPDIRIKIYKRLLEIGFELPKIISPLAYVSSHAKIAQGTIIMHLALINAGAHIGANCIINTKSLVEHDVIIEDNCHISTGAIVNGGAIIKECTFIGSHAVTIEKTTIGRECIVCAGAKVVSNIDDKTRYVM